MDNLDARNVNLGNAGEAASKKINVLNLSPEDLEEIKSLESQAVIGNTEFIRSIITEKYTQSYRYDLEGRLEQRIKYYPAFGGPFVTQGGDLEDASFVNTDLVKNPKIIPVLVHHESVEIVMQNKALDIKDGDGPMDVDHETIKDVANQIGIDPEIIENDPINTVAHYIAMYHWDKIRI